MKQLISNFLRDEQGQDLVEYTLLLAFVALAGAAVFTTLRGTISTAWSNVNSTVASAGAS